MEIFASILCGNNDAVVHDAVDSVIDWVDRVVVIDTGISDHSLSIIEACAKSKLVVARKQWSGNFSEMRNFALQECSKRGAGWALTVDTDERIYFAGYDRVDDLRLTLAEDANVLAWLVPSHDGLYAKERFLRIPTQARWEGRTHEGFFGLRPDQRRLLPGSSFYELPKAPEVLRAKLNRDLAILRDEVRRNLTIGRWWYYLGQTLADLKNHAEAALAFDQCSRHSARGEEGAWACFMAARSLSELRRFQESLERCALGLSVEPKFPELAWMAGWCCYQLKRYEDAICWSRIAITLGSVEGMQAGRGRMCFRYLIGWYEGPYDVMRYAYRRLGDTPHADEAERMWEVARARRESETGTR